MYAECQFHPLCLYRFCSSSAGIVVYPEYMAAEVRLQGQSRVVAVPSGRPFSDVVVHPFGIVPELAGRQPESGQRTREVGGERSVRIMPDFPPET